MAYIIKVFEILQNNRKVYRNTIKLKHTEKIAEKNSIFCISSLNYNNYSYFISKM